MPVGHLAYSAGCGEVLSEKVTKVTCLDVEDPVEVGSSKDGDIADVASVCTIGHVDHVSGAVDADPATELAVENSDTKKLARIEAEYVVFKDVTSLMNILGSSFIVS